MQIAVDPDICKIHLQTFVVFLQSQEPASFVARSLVEPPQAEHLGQLQLASLGMMQC